MLADDPDERIEIDDILHLDYFKGETATEEEIYTEFN